MLLSSVPDVSRSRRPPPDRARRVAFDALRRVNGDGAYANLVLTELLTRRGITGRDAAFATELLAGTCRGQGSYDLVIAAAAERATTSLQPAVLDLLRLGTHQILATRVPVHAAVAATVDLAADTVGPRVTGLVNAVLRRVAAHSLDQWLDRLAEGLEPLDQLAVRTAHPRWIVDAYADLLPFEEVEAALRANNADVPVTLAVRPGLAEVGELLAAGAEPSRYSEFAVRWTGNPADLPAVREGRAGAQDEGSQLVTIALAAASSLRGRWLDLCAGPGGKTALLAGLADAPGAVLAVDVAPHRAALVRRAVRAYPEPPTVLVADGTRPAWRPGSFARVLADVPCTGLGALRRRPESRWRRQPGEVEQLHGLQRALLASALDSASPGGVVGYVTCSPHRRETVDVVAETLASRDDVEVVPATGLLPESLDAAHDDFVQLWPHRHGTDAMFAAYLRRL
jgi:16S rRNA (cytosine967-C5)-methyltransferase